MVVVQARHLSHHSPLSSLLFEPTFLSLALMHSDSSFSLYPSISPFSLPTSLPPPRTTVPPPSSAAAFLPLRTPTLSRLLFLVSSPLSGGSSVLFRFWVLRKTHNNSKQSFARARVICNQADLAFDERKSGVVFNVSHGVAVKLVGSVNVFAMYSVSARKVWVFAVKITGRDEEGDDGFCVKLMKTAVIDCCSPVFSICVSLGFLILGEENGVRVFPLRPLVKGRVRKYHSYRRGSKYADGLESNALSLPNGPIRPINSNVSMNSEEGTMEKSSNGHWEERSSKYSDRPKVNYVKLRQDPREGGACFVAFKSDDDQSFNQTKTPLKSVMAVSIQVLSQKKFLILDSVGDIYLLSLSNIIFGSDVPCKMRKLTLTVKVQNLAVLPDVSTRAQTVWLSDGLHTLYTVVVSDLDSSGAESDIKIDEENMQCSGRSRCTDC